jgi:hypothetical protein
VIPQSLFGFESGRESPLERASLLEKQRQTEFKALISECQEKFVRIRDKRRGEL